MKLRATIRRIFAILLVLGLALAPLSRPVMASALPETSATAEMSAMDDMAATDGVTAAMPCCPSKAPAPISCDKCILMAACMSQCFAGVATALFGVPFAVSGKMAPLKDESWPEGLGHPPPEDPPRTAV